jgi:hypothetical protein
MLGQLKTGCWALLLPLLRQATGALAQVAGAAAVNKDSCSFMKEYRRTTFKRVSLEARHEVQCSCCRPLLQQLLRMLVLRWSRACTS